MMKLDRSMLPEGVSLDRKEGVYAELDALGRVVHLGEYQNGQRKVGSWALSVAPDGSSARVEMLSFFEWSPERGSSDAEASTSLARWAEPWVRRIAAPMDPRPREDMLKLTCSFCGKFQLEVKKLIAGPGVYICNECISLCHDLLSEEGEADKEQ